MADYKNGYKPQTVDYGNTAANGPRRTSGYGVTTTNQKPPSKFKEHMRKKWWHHLIIFVVSTLLISMLLTYVALPKIAQSDVNKAEMFINEQVIMEPEPDQINLHVVSTVKSHSMFIPTLDSFEAKLFLENTEPDIKPFGAITIPSVHATKTSITDVKQTMKIINMEQFKAYNKLVTQAKSFRLGVRGRTKLHLGALPVVTVDFNKAVNMSGLNSLIGVEVRDIKVSLTAGPDGNNMEGMIMIPNPSVMTLNLGDIVQDIYANGNVIGNATINNVILKPGPNLFPMKSAADQISVITILQGDKSKSGVLPVEARCRTVTYKGKRLEYFEYAMQQTPVKLNLNLKEPLQAIGLDLFSTGSGTGGGTGTGSESSSSSASAAPTTSAEAPTTAAAAPTTAPAAPAPPAE